MAQPGSLSPVQQSPRTQIFDYLAQRTCKVIWGNPSQVETSGAFIKINDREVQVLTCFHDISWKDLPIGIIHGASMFDANISVVTPTYLAAHQDIVVLNLVLDEGKTEPTYFFDIGRSRTFVQRGEEIYFSGFPLGERAPTTQVGYVCGTDRPRRRFKIDATVMSGHSGGVVCRMNVAGIELIGVISSQLVDLSTTFLRIATAQPESIRAKNDPAPSYAGRFDMVAAIQQMNHAILSNLSMGIANVTFVTDPLLPESISPPDPEEKQKAGDDYEEEETWETGVSEVFRDMQRPDPWMQSKLGMTSTQTSSSSQAGTSVSEMPVMKKTEVESKLKTMGFKLRNQGGDHEIWGNGDANKGATVSVPRHTQIKKGTAESILKQAREALAAPVETPPEEVLFEVDPVPLRQLEAKLKEYRWYVSMNGEKNVIWSNGEMDISVPNYETIDRAQAIEFVTTARDKPRV